MPVLTNPLGWFTLQFPEGWQTETEDCVTKLRSPLGMAYISGGRHAGGRQASFGGADFLARFLRSLGLDVEEEGIVAMQGCGCRIYSYTRDGEADRWRYWSVTDDETALLISYTCSREDAQKEAAAVESMVRSVQLFHSAPAH